jgi:hypothetical protein
LLRAASALERLVGFSKRPPHSGEAIG